MCSRMGCEVIVGVSGLAKLFDPSDSHVITAVCGVGRLIASEYSFTGQFSKKTDVFRFGILVLEFITKMRALEFGKTKIQQEKKVEVLVERELGCNYDNIDMGKILQVTLLCAQHLPAYSPKMSEVVKMMEDYKVRS
ncbi:hypothetical protein PVL29_007045 [Vitis rotundifolia]|uniref:Serine-threonine/tyrosine-protein kinase catalytic domain-containing protein n=1 Tax=Vitis rotundifolia TaxID=103349 RepID=A0AA39DUT0_VITRO|nr:hypothetical protein PVL29_007045 [Vitis rotundifolia]